MGVFWLLAGIAALVYMAYKDSPGETSFFLKAGCLIMPIFLLVGASPIIGISYVYDHFDSETAEIASWVIIFMFIFGLVCLAAYMKDDDERQDEIRRRVREKEIAEWETLSEEECRAYFDRARHSMSMNAYLMSTKYGYKDGRPGHRGTLTHDNIVYDHNDEEHRRIADGQHSAERYQYFRAEAKRDIRREKRKPLPKPVQDLKNKVVSSITVDVPKDEEYWRQVEQQCLQQANTEKEDDNV